MSPEPIRVVLPDGTPIHGVVELASERTAIDPPCIVTWEIPFSYPTGTFWFLLVRETAAPEHADPETPMREGWHHD